MTNDYCPLISVFIFARGQKAASARAIAVWAAPILLAIRINELGAQFGEAFHYADGSVKDRRVVDSIISQQQRDITGRSGFWTPGMNSEKEQVIGDVGADGAHT